MHNVHLENPRINLVILRYSRFEKDSRNVDQTVLMRRLMRRLVTLGGKHATELGFHCPDFGLKLTGQINNIAVFSSCYYGKSIKCVTINK